MESLLRNLEKYVTCSICLDNLTKPKTIACLHTFCLKCLEEHTLKTQTDKNNFDAQIVKRKLTFLKEIVSMICRLIFCKTVC